MVIDYFADDGSTVEVEMDERVTLPEEATRRFALYSRSRRATAQINSRLTAIHKQLVDLEARRESLEKIISARDQGALENFAVERSGPPAIAGESGPKPQTSIPGARRYVSSDGFEILVGRAARDNDYLTFKVARPNDLWLHAADYGGSHVVVRNSTRTEIPHRTIIEAAQFATHFSQASKD